jgi:hypothetical protein
MGTRPFIGDTVQRRPTLSLPRNLRRRRELLTTGARTTSEFSTFLTFVVPATGMTMHPNGTVRRILFTIWFWSSYR